MTATREQLAEALLSHAPYTVRGRVTAGDLADVLAPLVDRIADQRAADELEKAAAYWDRPNLRTIAADLRDRAALAARPTADTALRDALRIHHPIMRSETGPFSGCRCGQVRLGEDVIAHVVTELRAALDGDR